MNEFKRLKLGTEFDNGMIASLAGVDVAIINLFEMQLGIIDFNTAITICNVLDVTFFDMFPAFAHLAPGSAHETEDKDWDEFAMEIFEDETHRASLIANGLDPDMRPWFAHVYLKSGNDRRYRLSSLEMARMQFEMSTAENVEGYFVLYADCQNIIIKRSALASVRFTNSLSYAPFSSEERGLAMTLVSSSFTRPKEVGVLPDNPEEGAHGRPLLTLIEKARTNAPLQPFIRLPEDNDARFVNIEEFEVIEIPLGLTVPGFYDEDEPEQESSGVVDLSTAEPVGSA